MKKNLLILALIFALVIVSGCNKNEVDKPEINLGNNEKQEIADTLPENNQKETKDDNAEYVINYEDALAKVYAFINNIDDEVGPIDGFDGIWEAAKALGDDALNEIGYVLKDISGDNVPELLIGAFEKDDDT
jgi:hypothetical protein